MGCLIVHQKSRFKKEGATKIKRVLLSPRANLSNNNYKKIKIIAITARNETAPSAVRIRRAGVAHTCTCTQPTCGSAYTGCSQQPHFSCARPQLVRGSGLPLAAHKFILQSKNIRILDTRIQARYLNLVTVMI